jgi:hypothetical protein
MPDPTYTATRRAKAALSLLAIWALRWSWTIAAVLWLAVPVAWVLS